MKPSSYYNRIVDVMDELVRFTILLRRTAPSVSTAIRNGKRRGGGAINAAIDVSSIAVSRQADVANPLFLRQVNRYRKFKVRRKTPDCRASTMAIGFSATSAAQQRLLGLSGRTCSGRRRQV